ALGQVLDPEPRFQKKPALQGNGAVGSGDGDILACAVCKDAIHTRPGGFVVLREDCTEAMNKFAPTDVELWSAQEFRLGRPVTMLREIPSCVFFLRGLRCLDLTGHPVAQIPSEIALLSTLRRLVFIALNITEVPKEVGSLKLLEQFMMTGCPVRRLPEEMGLLPNLWDFYLDGNQLESLPAILPRYNNGIKASGNILESLPENIGDCSDAKNLRAYGNKLTRIPDSVCRMDRLVEVSLQGNLLRSLPEAIGNVRSIKYFSVHDNQLEHLPDSIASLPELQWLYVYNNRLQVLPRRLLSRARKLERFFVEANPLSAETAVELLSDVPGSVRVLGVDAAQVQTAVAAKTGAPLQLPPSVNSGWMLPWGNLYAKLAPSSQLRRAEGVLPLSSPEPVYGGDVLVVAFAASQGEPEWLGSLGQVASGKVPLSEERIVREPVGSSSLKKTNVYAGFSKIYEDLLGFVLTSKGDKVKGRPTQPQ
ncbi:unnamed protein product, partial [Polarella glacialis]